jgi:hypothetical protein
MLDRRKLAAPVFAQATAFVVVLVIGGFTGHSPAPSQPAHPATTSPSASVGVNAASSPAAQGHGPKLTVKVVTPAGPGLSLAGTQVAVLQNRTLTSVASGTLNSAQQYAVNVPSGDYQVCLSPPNGLNSVVPSGHSLGSDWICNSTHVGTGPQTVTFRLTPGTGT